MSKIFFEPKKKLFAINTKCVILLISFVQIQKRDRVLFHPVVGGELRIVSLVHVEGVDVARVGRVVRQALVHHQAVYHDRVTLKQQKPCVLDTELD